MPSGRKELLKPTLEVDAAVLRPPQSGIGIYLREVLSGLEGAFSLRLRGLGDGSSGRARSIRRLPFAYRLKQLRQGWPPVPPNAIYWTPNYVLPAFPLRPAHGVITVHDLIFLEHPAWADRARGKFLRRALPASLAHAERVIVTSQAVKQALIARFAVPPERVQVIALGVRQLPRGAPLEDGVRPVVVCGNLEPRKDTLSCVHAHRGLPSAVRARHPLWIIGHPLDAAYAQKVRAALDPPYARDLGGLGDEALGGAYAQAAVVVAPSLAEGFGMVPLEAYVSGVPVVAADLAITRELLGDRVSYFTPGDAADLTRALRGALEIPRRPSEAERAEIAARFSWDRCRRAHAALFSVLADALRSQ